LIPGLGADERQWEPQRRAFPGLLVPAWIPPARDDTLPSYAARLADAIPRARPILLGGSSFGGTLACEMAERLRPKALILIGSCRSTAAIRRDVRLLRPVLSHLPAWGVAAVKPLAPLVLYSFGGLTAEQKRLCAAMFRASDRDWLRWAIRAILHWQPHPIPDLPVFHIHGRRDRMIRASRVAADEVLPDGGHLINMSHAEAVNEFIRSAASAVGAVIVE
jgi:pimeloyl-ACP methyl ester carboxylesterase